MITNPPWEQSVVLGGGASYDDIMDIILRNIKPSGRVLLIIDQDTFIKYILRTLEHGMIQLTHPFRVSGLLCYLVVLDSKGLFRQTRKGELLKSSYEKFGKVY